MEKNVYVVNCEALENGVYDDMNAVFSTMEKAKKYIASEIRRLNGTNVVVAYDESDYYETKFTNTYIDELQHQIEDEVSICAVEYEIDIEC